MPTSSNGPRAYAVAVAFVTTSLACALLVRPHAEREDLAMIHLLGIVFLALKSSVRVSVLASLLSIALFDFFFIKPEFEFAWTDAKSSLTFLAMIFVAFTVSSLSENQRRQEQRARAVAFRAQALYELNVELSSSRDIRQLSAVTARHLESLFGARVNILMGTLDGGLEAAAGPRSAAAAQKALLRREFITERAAAGTTIWVPVSGVRSTLGVIELEVSEPFERDSEQGYVLMACANQFGTAVEGAQTAGAMQRAKFEAETERMRSSLLSAVSHDLRTPLATMIAAGTTLASKRSELPEEDTEMLISSIVSEGQRLNRLISNLLSVTRLESATVEIRRSPESIEDIVRSALDRLASRHHMLPVTTHFHSAPLPLVSAEPLLLEQVLVNLIENAVVHAATPVSIEVLHAAGAASVTVQVADRGPGIAEHEREKVFEKFYRGGDKPRSDGGVGLGLTICRAIVRAHEGRIAVRDRSGGGTIVEFSVPLAEDRVVSLEASS
jgi:two-component system sensor histidine kinase KdpD